MCPFYGIPQVLMDALIRQQQWTTLYTIASPNNNNITTLVVQDVLLLIIWMMVKVIDEGCNDEGLWEMKQRVKDVETIFWSLSKKVNTYFISETYK